MMSLIQKDQSLNLVHEQEIIADGLRLTFTLDDSASYSLDFVSMEIKQEQEQHSKTITECEFRNSEAGLAAKLVLTAEDHITTLSVAATIENPKLFEELRYFSSNNSIVVTFEKFPGVTGVLGHYRFNDWWTRPHTVGLSSLPGRTQQLLIKREASYIQLLPLCDSDCKTELRGTGDGGVQVILSPNTGGFAQIHSAALVLGIHQDPFELVERTTEAARKELQYRPALCEKQYPEKLEYLGWCSWDAFYQNVTEDGIVQKCYEFKKYRLPVRWVMIDDGWLDIKDKKLVSFQADQTKFPNGLSSVVKKLKDLDIDSVGVWHTIAGYWGGIHPESKLAEKYREYLMALNSGTLIPACNMNGFGFWNEFHKFLEDQGISMIKVDGQSALANFSKYHMSIGQAARGGHLALEASAGIHFHNQMINCMGMATENMWNRPATSISRNSDDFVPQNPDNFAEHALQNVYNSYYHGQLYWGDWDMFWTVHQDAERHALLRAVSGGPVYFSDPPHATNPQVLWPLIDDKGRILRCDMPGMPTLDCLTVNPAQENAALKIWNRCGESGVIAAFHISSDKSPIHSSISPSDVNGIVGESFAVYEYFSKNCFIVSKTEKINFIIEEQHLKLYVIVPLEHGVAPIGLTNKYISPKTIKGVHRDSSRISFFLEEGGEFSFVSARKPLFAEVDGNKIPIGTTANTQLYRIDCKDLDGPVCIQVLLDE
ncbi:Sip1-related alpha-galactosidase [Paenibacillus sp. Soil724D2]|uniref:Sip1-related alpha-galactosidase n=1 Tax=Paenibacillus sp. (strain Soil724D2) TaxID=1736392 RepID=UPI000713CC20|nr:Sip1-related alpha-galactosidase [Paenibacillus sp. Soil724D2]KRE48425.1 hypothetical protein ASG85_05330 [Paenibacillus sp. Soil724D2]